MAKYTNQELKRLFEKLAIKGLLEVRASNAVTKEKWQYDERAGLEDVLQDVKAIADVWDDSEWGDNN